MRFGLTRNVVLLGALLIMACSAEEEGSMLEIRYAARPNDSCDFAVDSQEFISRGIFDPAGARVFILALSLVNKLTLTEDDPVEGFEGREVRPESNNVSVQGFDTCWFRADDPRVSQIGSHADGRALDCSDLPETQKGFIPSSGTVPAGRGLAIIRADVLTHDALRAPGIFDQSFDPSAIPIGDDPRSSSRSAAWGNFPSNDFSTPVIVQLRAVGVLGSGRTVRSNWFAHPIDICPTCILGTCSTAPIECADGSIGTAFFEIDFSTSCLPFQGIRLECVQVRDDCP